MLFFFELAFFILAMIALALAEFVSRGLALGLWIGVTTLSYAWSTLARAALARTPAVDRSEEQWRRTVEDSWRYFNRLLLVGLAALALWWWLGAR